MPASVVVATLSCGRDRLGARDHARLAVAVSTSMASKPITLAIGLMLSAPLAPGAPLQLFWIDGVGQGCPIASEYALTARHVALRTYPDGHEEARALVWSAHDRAGSARAIAWDARRDLALLQLSGATLDFYPISAAQPSVGTSVRIFGYDIGRGFRSRTDRARVLNVLAGHLVLSESGGPGYSGSCVLTASDEIVGVVQWIACEEGRCVTVASAVWPPWDDLLRMRPAAQ